MWICEDDRGLKLIPKVWMCVGIVCFLWPKIEGLCIKPELNENVVVLEDNANYTEDSSVRLSCIPGYEPASGSRTVKCKGGTWDPDPMGFTCKKKSCGSPGEVTNGQYNMSEGVEFGAVVTAICNVGYYLVGEGRRTCLADGTWSGRDAVCEVVKCASPPPITNSQLESPAQEEYTYGQVVEYKCHDGYTLFGNREIHCSQNGSWTERPRCKIVECPRPNITNAQRIEGTSGPYGNGAVLVYKCNEGFEMEGEPRIVCEENGWSPAVPRCKAVPTTTTQTTPRTTVKETTPPKVSTSSPDQTTQRSTTKTESSTTEGGNNGAPLLHGSLWMVMAAVMAVAAQNGLFFMSLR